MIICLQSYTFIDSPSLGASALLFLSSVPRFGKGPVPKMLSVSSAGAGMYYAKLLSQLRG